MHKTLFLDLDRTLLNDQKECSDANKAAIRKALSYGHRIVLTSGRPLIGIKPIAEELGLTTKNCYLIAYNGGEIYDLDNDKVLYKKALPIEHVLYLFEESARWGLHCQTYDDRQVITTSDTPALRRYSRHNKIATLVVPDIAAALTKDPVKVIVIDLEDHDKLVRFRKETAAGDTENDISMLQTVHTGIAMANADPEVKAIADYITANDHNHSGVAELVEKFLLN